MINKFANKFRKLFLTTGMIMFLLFSVVHHANAYVAWPDIVGFQYDEMVRKVWKQVEDALVASLKREAAQMVADTMNNIISGGKQAGALFITDWDNYLFANPNAATQAYMNDFFTITTRGKSYGSYNSACGSNFSEWRTAGAREAVNEQIDLTSLQTTLEEVSCNGLAGMFDNLNWNGYVESMKLQNDPIAYKLLAESIAQKKKEEEEKKAETKATAYLGFKPQTDKNGYVVTPGSLVQSLSATANSMDMNMIVNARSVGEVAGIVAGKIASSVIKRGIGNIRKNIQANINKGICNTSQSLRDGLKNLTPQGSLQGSLGLGSLGRTRDYRCTLH
ncbi:MAG TPA: hypothetical protein ENJ49_00665 [Candidatus Moranbacteria bacterium]|nr:hypothetical protein [Candidatus Moranbacteria bacterium]